jgi:hypothetical protein
MARHPDVESAESTADKCARRRPSAQAPSGGAVYGLGMIGAAVWFWQQADGAGEHVVGLLKALVWPAFLVYKAFEALQG